MVTGFVYDDAGQMTSMTLPDGSVMTYEYDAADRLVETVFPSGRVLTYARDAIGRVVAVETQVSSGGAVTVVADGIGWQPFGPLAALNWGGAASDYPLTRAFDLDGRMTSSVILDNVGAAQVQQDFGYIYDLAGNITEITDNLVPADTENLAWDALHRLASAGSASGPYYARDYIYDAVGNRLAEDWAGSPAVTTQSFAAGSNRITARQNTTHTGVITNWTYTQSDSGNRETMVAPGPVTSDYIYDSTDRLVEVKLGGVTAGSFQHNAAGQRVAKTNAYATKHFLYDLAGRLIAERKSTGASLKEYIRLDGMILGYVSGGALYWVHQDHIGQPLLVASQNGDPQWWTRYKPFGAILTGKTGGAVPINLRYPGQYYDWESGLRYNGFRDYDAYLGRYAQSDPIGLRGGWNTYVYAEADPTGYIDEFGLRRLPIQILRLFKQWEKAMWSWNDTKTDWGGSINNVQFLAPIAVKELTAEIINCDLKRIIGPEREQIWKSVEIDKSNPLYWEVDISISLIQEKTQFIWGDFGKDNSCPIDECQIFDLKIETRPPGPI